MSSECNSNLSLRTGHLQCTSRVDRSEKWIGNLEGKESRGQEEGLEFRESESLKA